MYRNKDTRFSPISRSGRKPQDIHPMTIDRHASAEPIRVLTVTKAAWWEGRRQLKYRLTTSDGDALPKWLARAVGQLAPVGRVLVDVYPDGARLYHPLTGWSHDAGKHGRRK